MTPTNNIVVFDDDNVDNDIFSSGAEALVNPVNCAGASGARLALEFAAERRVSALVPIRASSIPHWMDCAARQAAISLDGRAMPASPEAALGSAVHKSTAVYDQSKLDGSGITIEESAAAAADYIRVPPEEVAWEEGAKARGKLADVAVSLHKLYCREVAPRQSYEAVDVTCERLDITDLGISLTGSVDRVYSQEGEFGIADLKTGKAVVDVRGAVATKGHAGQLGVYELLAERASGIEITAPAKILGIQAGKTARGQRTGEGQIHGARDALIGDADRPGILEFIAHYIRSGMFPGNPRSMMCHKKYCPIYNNCRLRR